ncbi:NAD(P)H-hydrate dehydratase [Lacihabitans sp. LS3-19]|uniref:NAD(P)H-hydrate dehydratase n=1 Tax=Lacihabitans sp. LS3-19 TaxID=2487335 RepID=UPI0020CBD3CB|nr:NAD(P)H-hydrate dehydratase [Lacihabitans sp. LS3-19]MCP9768273.1 NAD(P)H-hydrate dehydratase [Lacihabitans sp. LS3-19]
MKILSAKQTKELDAYTISEEPIASIDLMERASEAFYKRFIEKFDISYTVLIFCGTGNNGGDGLAVARKIHQAGYELQTFVVGDIAKSSPDFKINLDRLNSQYAYKQINNIDEITFSNSNKTIIIDAFFGSGLNRKIEGLAAEIIEKINLSGIPIVSIDIASGLAADKHSEKGSIIKPKFTISFQMPKLAFFMPKNEAFVGDWETVDIGLSNKFIEKVETKNYFITNLDIKPINREKNSHKGTFGHALLIAGSEGMMGAAVLSAKACLRSGVGKVTVHSPKPGLDILQISIPEAIVSLSQNENHFAKNWKKPFLGTFDAIGIGPGIGTKNLEGFKNFLENIPQKPIVIDADAINMLGKNPDLLKLVPENSIFTPHPKEFRNLTGKVWRDDFEKLEILREFAVKNHFIVCLKGHNTAIALPNGNIYFNTTGNTGMATAGSGDVLTGIILGFLAQGYSPKQAAIQGVFEHGLAGDRASKARSERAMIASDILEWFR